MRRLHWESGDSNSQRCPRRSFVNSISSITNTKQFRRPISRVARSGRRNCSSRIADCTVPTARRANLISKDHGLLRLLETRDMVAPQSGPAPTVPSAPAQVRENARQSKTNRTSRLMLSQRSARVNPVADGEENCCPFSDTSRRDRVLCSRPISAAGRPDFAAGMAAGRWPERFWAFVGGPAAGK